MRFLIPILLFFSVANGQPYTFSFTQIDTGSTNDYLRPGAGLNEFGNTHFIDYPTPGVTNNHPLDLYSRWKWCEIQSSLGSFNWSDIDNKFNTAIDRGQKVGLGFEIISDYATCNTVGGAILSYPAFVHTAMQGETNKDWIATDGNDQWVPNWNSGLFHIYYKHFLNTVANHLRTTSRAGKSYYSVLEYVDDRGFGNYGEWHLYGAGHGATPPTGTKAVDSSFRILSDATKNAFPDVPIIININALNGANSSSDVSTAHGYYLLTASNSWGPYGIRWDHACDVGTYNYDYTNNTTNLNGLTFKTEIANRYKVAPFLGEPQQFNYAQAGQCDYSHVMTELMTYHASMIENANIVNASSSCVQSGFRSFAKRLGYRYTLTGGQMSDSLRPGTNLNIQLQVANVGIAPTYENWTATYEFRQGGIVRFSYTSTFRPQFFLPGVATIIDNQILPTSLSGSYDLYLIIRDAGGYRQPLPLQITGRIADGSYLLRAGIRVATTGGGGGPPPPPPPNLPPVILMGGDQTDTLPKNVDTLFAQVSDPNGDALTYQWTQNPGGPNTATMVAPTTLLNRITGLIEGQYSFRLTANDGKGGISTADIRVIVIDTANGVPVDTTHTPPVYRPPIITAGNDTVIYLADNTAVLNVDVLRKDTAIASVTWFKYSGPNTFTIVSPTDSTTDVTGLIRGDYQFRVTVVDRAGNSREDFVTVSVRDLAIPPPPLQGPSKQKQNAIKQ